MVWAITDLALLGGASYTPQQTSHQLTWELLELPGQGQRRPQEAAAIGLLRVWRAP